jgi:hypothetical protein
MNIRLSVGEMKEILEYTPTPELRDEYRLYCSLQSRGVQDEVAISLIEQELMNRGIDIEEFNSDFLS